MSKLDALRKAQRHEAIWEIVWVGSALVMAIGVLAIVFVTLELGLR